MFAASEIASSIPASVPFIPIGNNLPIGELGRFVHSPVPVGDRISPVPIQAMSRILVIEESLPLARLLAKGLASDRVAVDVAGGSEEADDLLAQQSYGVVVLGFDASRDEGLMVLHAVRAKLPSAGVMVLTGNGSRHDMLAMLDHGADDCLTKPFSLVELVARVRALHRRTGCAIQPTVKPARLVLNREEFLVERSGRRIELTPREFALLEFLFDNPGKTLSRSTLMQAVWKMSDETGSNTNIVDVYMKYLRDKLDCEGEESLIRTVRGIGYVLNNIN